MVLKLGLVRCCICTCECSKARLEVSNFKPLRIGKLWSQPSAWKVRLRLRMANGLRHLNFCLSDSQRALEHQARWVERDRGTPSLANILFDLCSQDSPSYFPRQVALHRQSPAGPRTQLARVACQPRQPPKYVACSVDGCSRGVPRAHTKENMEHFLDDVA